MLTGFFLTATNATHVLLRAFADELARCGMTDACTSPGSRCAPLVLAFAREPHLRCHSHIDERCAGFFALGLAKASGRPAAVVCTSGTAAAELMPAVIEAHEARVPLLVLTADRPPELRDIGAGQAIDQLKLYGSAPKWFCEVGTHAATIARTRWIRALACRAYWTAVQGRPGAVHVNWPLREPLVPDGDVDTPAPGRPHRRPWVARSVKAANAAGTDVELLTALVREHQQGVVVAGRQEQVTGLANEIRSFAEAASLPVLADPLSRARAGACAIAHYDSLLADRRFAAEHRPTLVVRVGDLPTSKPLRGWLADLDDVEHVVLDAEASWHDPDSVTSWSLGAHPTGTLAGARRGLERAGDRSPWLKRWREADDRAARALDEGVDRALEHGLSEPWIARQLGRTLPDDATLFVASSMPVRDVESFWPVRDHPPRVLCNRGANGIDGTTSSAYGAAAASEGRPVVLLTGDVALAHDIGGLLAARRLGLALTIVVVNNDGGGIFEFLEVSMLPEVFEQHVLTPPGLDVRRAAHLYGLEHRHAGDPEAFNAAMREFVGAPGQSGAGGIIEVRTDRVANRRLHDQLRQSVARISAGP